jgi:DNA replication protein DnaC
LIKTLEGFDFDSQTSIYETLVRQLAGGEYLDGRENVLLIGNSGTGKTHLASALGFAACTQGKRVRFWSATDLVMVCAPSVPMTGRFAMLLMQHLRPIRAIFGHSG